MKKLKEGFGKFLKGMFGIFVLKVMLLGVFLVYQACETDDTPTFESQAKENFMEALETTSKSLSSIKLKKLSNEDSETFERTDLSVVVEEVDGTTIVCSKEDIVFTNDGNDGNTGNGSVTLADFVGVNLVPKDQVDPSDEGTEHCYSFNNDEVEESFEPSVSAARSYFYAQGLTDNDIDEMLDGENEIYLVQYVNGILAAEDIENSIAVVHENNLIPFIFGIDKSFAQDTNNTTTKIWDCFWRATGISAFAESFDAVKTGNKRLIKKLGKKAIKKIASKFLGPIGAAIAIVDFTICMNS